MDSFTRLTWKFDRFPDLHDLLHPVIVLGQQLIILEMDDLFHGLSVQITPLSLVVTIVVGSLSFLECRDIMGKLGKGDLFQGSWVYMMQF